MKVESDSEGLGESSSLLNMKGFGKDQSAALSSPPSGSTTRQQPESDPSTGTQNESLKEERIEVGADRMDFSQFQGYFPRIFEVVSRGDHKALSDLLTKCPTEVNSINSEGNTALHHAVTLACCKGDSDGSFYECIDLLMNCQQMKINMLNLEGYTAVGIAVEYSHKKTVKYMLKHSSADRLYLEYYLGDREYTVREIILQNFTDLQSLLPALLMESLDSSDRDRKLLATLQHDQYDTFE